jgi:hypothetical protein
MKNRPKKVPPQPKTIVYIRAIKEYGIIHRCRKDTSGEFIIEVLRESDGEIHLCRECELLRTSYQFYDLPEDERKAMTGKPFQELTPGDSLYFPVDLKEGTFNYGETQGLLFVTQLHPTHPTSPNWFRLGVSSPDDLDMDLDFNSPDSPKHREQVIKLLSDPALLTDVSYDDVLNFVQKEIGAGERTS